MQIQRPSSLVDQVSAILRKRILDHDYQPGQRLPSESELAKELKVSRTTVRTVLTKFANEGLVFRKQGDGTYVNKQAKEIDNHYGSSWDFSKLIEGNGYTPSISTISLDSLPATEEDATLLELAPDSEVIHIKRLFSADDEPVIHVTNIFPKSLLNLEVDQIDGNLPIYKIVENYFNQELAYVVSDIQATLAEKNLKQTLFREEGFPLLKLIETFYSHDHKPLILGVSYYDFTKLKLKLVQSWKK